MSAGPTSFLHASSAVERRALLASTLGWMLDGMDVTLYAMVLPRLLHEFQLSTSQAGFLASVTLVASAAGGILFGILADRFGRRFALMSSIAVYSVFTAACGLSHSVTELAVYRALLGLGMGGEWATGAALVAETWSAEHRGKALGLMQSGFAVGYALAALIAAVILPRWGWRDVFFVGLLPAFLTLWISRRVEESPLWLLQHAGVRGSGFGLREKSTLDENFKAEPQDPHPEPRTPKPESRTPSTRGGYAEIILVTLLMNSAAMFAWWGLFTWIPSYLALPLAEGGRGMSIAASTEWIVAMQAGMWLGYVSFGFVSDRIGRKKTYIGYLLVAAALVPWYAHAHDPGMLLLLGPLVAFFGTGHFTGFGIITAELFPTSIRASAMGLTYNFGRALSAAAPWAIGAAARQHGLSSAFWISGLAFLVAGMLALAVPETRGRGL
jgi:MFS family permease